MGDSVALMSSRRLFCFISAMVLLHGAPVWAQTAPPSPAASSDADKPPPLDYHMPPELGGPPRPPSPPKPASSAPAPSPPVSIPDAPPPLDYKMPAELGGPGTNRPASPGMIIGGALLGVAGLAGVGAGFLFYATADDLAAPILGTTFVVGGGVLLAGGILLISYGARSSSSAMTRYAPAPQAALSLGAGTVNFRMSF